MRRLLPALLLCAMLALSAADCGGDASASAGPPKPKEPAGLSLTVAGDTLTARWVWKAPGLLPGDTGYVQWSQRKSGATGFTNLVMHKTLGMSDAYPVPMPAAGSFDTVRVCIRVVRPGAPDSPNPCVKKGRSTPQPPSGGADSLTLSQIILRTVPADGHAIASYAGQTTPADSNRVRVCAFGVLSDGRRVKLQNSWGVPECETAYQSWLAERQA